MSRIGKAIIEIPANVTVTEKDGLVTVKGPKGELTQQLSEGRRETFVRETVRVKTT